MGQLLYRRAIPVLFAVVAGFAAGLAVTPAPAQFGSIFRDEPPRPPGEVPRGVPPPPSTFEQPVRPRTPTDQRPTFQTLQPSAPPAREWVNPDTLPQSGVQTQPLAPLPGVAAPPAQATNPATNPAGVPANDPLRGAQEVTPGQQATPGSLPGSLPGLPPGQRQPRGAPPQPANTAPQPGDEVVVAPPEQKIVNPTAVFSGLDKITGRTITFDVAINETVQFGALQVTPRACYTRPPTETQNTDAFVAVDEVTLQGDVKRIFSGWMFAASPGLNAVEHPIYDVWLVDCKGGSNAATAEAEPAAPAAPPPKPPTRTQRRSNAQPAPFR